MGEDGEAWCTQTYSEGVWGESDSISKEAEDIEAEDTESKWTVFHTPLPKQLQRAEAGELYLSYQARLCSTVNKIFIYEAFYLNFTQ